MREWKEKLLIGDLWQDEGISDQSRVQGIWDRISDSDWYGRLSEVDTDLYNIIDEMYDCAYVIGRGVFDPEWFDGIWDAFYDWCDLNSVWVDLYEGP